MRGHVYNAIYLSSVQAGRQYQRTVQYGTPLFTEHCFDRQGHLDPHGTAVRSALHFGTICEQEDIVLWSSGRAVVAVLVGNNQAVVSTGVVQGDKRIQL